MNSHESVLVPVADLRPHPRNYRDHPADQVEHIKASIQANGFYRNIVLAEDNTILGGHGVIKACQELGLANVHAVRLPIDPESPQAIKILTGDNAIGRLAFDDDRALTNLLKELADEGDLLGTGFDESQLAALLMTTRTAAEIKDFDAAAEWVGMPDYEPGEQKLRLVVCFENAEDRERFVLEKELELDSRGKIAWSTRWPWTDRKDPVSLKFES
jgi:hypothetical protein